MKNRRNKMYRELGIARHNLRTLTACLLGLLTIGLTTAAAFPDPANTITFTLNGAAKLVTLPQGPVLVLTPAQQSQVGTAFLTNSIAFKSSYTFETFFQFKMTNANPGCPGDGMAFVLQTESANAQGGGGGGLGYQGITPSIAVEFDTFQNSFDINNNHVAILTDGLLSDLDPQTPYGVSNCSSPIGVFGCMSNGDLWSVWIEYDGTNLNVAIADNSVTRPANLISYPIDIAGLLGQDSAFVGFTAATGSCFEGHVIGNWHFSETASQGDAVRP